MHIRNDDYRIYSEDGFVKLNVNNNTIKELAYRKSTFENGQLYYLQRRVSDLSFNDNFNTIFAIVEGEDDYDVEIELTSSGDILTHHCDCPAHAKYEGACKHVVATLFAAMIKNNSSSSKLIKANESNSDLISYYEYFDSSTYQDECVKLDITLNIERYYTNYLPSLDFKIGINRLYVIKNISEFIKKLISDTSLEFGKGFIYHPSKNLFLAHDAKIINLLKELYELEELQKTLSPYNRYSSQISSFRGKKVYLSQVTLRRVLDIIKDTSFNLTLGDKEIQNIIILNQDLPLQFILKKQKSNLMLEMKDSNLPIPITQDKDYFLYNNTIFKVSDKQRQYFSPILNAYMKDKSTLVFKGDESSRFVSAVLPYLKKISYIEITEEVDRSIHNTALLTKIYLDKENSNISANVEFHYDNYKVNPFLSYDTVIEDNKILVRDIENEKSILNQFEQFEFKVKNGLAYLDAEDKIYDFIHISLPVLQSEAEVYYSESFSNIKIKDSKAFSSKVRLNTNLNLLEFSFEHNDIDIRELSDIFSSLRFKKKYHRLKDGSFVPLNDGNLQSIADLMNNLDIDDKDLDNNLLQLPKFRAIYLDEQLKKLNLINVERNQDFKLLVQNILESQDMEFDIPLEVDGVLRSYQKNGFKWLKTLSYYGLGGILADDMGLGKTIQAIAFILSNRDNLTPSIVVAPSSLIYNWQDEVVKFAPELKVTIITGNKNQRQELISNIKDFDIVITSYPLIRRDIDLYDNILFDYCFIDEAQHIKNPTSINARSVKQLKAKGYFALTGTPIENSLSELWSIFDFVMCGYLLGHRRFLDKYERPIVKHDNKKSLEALRSQIKPFILRRLKNDVLKELPDKIETRIVAELSVEQKSIYLAYLEQAKGEVAKELKDNGFQKSHIKILSILTRLRQICCHPATFIEDYSGSSGKMELLEELIVDALSGGHRILLFSQFTSMLKIIKNWLTSMNIDYMYLDGSTPIKERGELVKDFNAGYGKIFLISLKAGGTGLNLTGADTVIHFDPWWNPAVEDQATDRAHRIGQKNTVQVIKIVTKGTIEEKVYELQQKKKYMVDSLIKSGETYVTKLSEDQLKSLFDI